MQTASRCACPNYQPRCQLAVPPWCESGTAVASASAAVVDGRSQTSTPPSSHMALSAAFVCLLQSCHPTQSGHQAPSAAASLATAAPQAPPLAACAPLAHSLRAGPWRTASPANLATLAQWALSLQSSASPPHRHAPSGSGHQAVLWLLHSACATQVGGPWLGLTCRACMEGVPADAIQGTCAFS